MTNVQLFDQVPLWAVLGGAVVLVLLSVRLGLYLAHCKRKRQGQEAEGPVGAVVGATLGLLAFMLAFAFGMAASRFDTRRALLLDEVNAIGTTYLRADLIPEPHRTAVRGLLRKYVDVRVDLAQRLESLPRNPEILDQAIKASEKLQNQLWAHATALTNADLKNAAITALFIDSLNEMIDMQTKRVTVGRYRVPTIVWVVFCILTVLSMTAVGYQFGQSGRGNWLISLGLALSFSIVVLLITDLDRSAEGWLKVSQQPMTELQQQLQE